MKDPDSLPSLLLLQSIQSDYCDSNDQRIVYRPTDYKLSDIVGEDGCALCTELKLVELLKEELTRKAAELRVRINLSHSTINQRLPPEVLALIFAAYTFDPSYDDFSYDNDPIEDPLSSPGNPLLLGAVCRTWRDVAWSTPRLWASVTIHVDLRTSGHEKQTQLVREWLARAGSMPLSIRILESLRQRNGDISAVGPLMTTINQYSLRWRNLHIQLPTCMFPYIKPVGKRSPILRYLKVEGKHHFSNDLFSMDDTTFNDVLQLGETPELKYVSMQRISLAHLNVDWGNITHFKGDNMTIAECLEVVNRAPLLQHCSLQSTSGSTHGLSLPSSPIIAQHLQSFSVTLPNQGQALIQSITAPQLESFSIVAPPSGSLSAFLSRSNCHLQHLSVAFFGDQGKNLVDLLRSQPSLTALSLGWSPLPDLLFAELARSYDTPSAPPEFLPNLETLEFTSIPDNFSWERFAQIFPSLGTASCEDDAAGGAGVRSQEARDTGSGARRVRPWRSVKMTMVRDFGNAGRPGLLYIPETVLPRLRHARECGIEVDVKVTASFDGADARDWVQASEEFYEIEVESRIPTLLGPAE